MADLLADAATRADLPRAEYFDGTFGMRGAAQNDGASTVFARKASGYLANKPSAAAREQDLQEVPALEPRVHHSQRPLLEYPELLAVAGRVGLVETDRVAAECPRCTRAIGAHTVGGDCQAGGELSASTDLDRIHHDHALLGILTCAGTHGTDLGPAGMDGRAFEVCKGDTLRVCWQACPKPTFLK